MSLLGRWRHWWNSCFRCGLPARDRFGCMCPIAQTRRYEATGKWEDE